MKTIKEQEMELQHGCYVSGVEPMNSYNIEAGTLHVIALDRQSDANRLSKIVKGHIKKTIRGAFEVTIYKQINNN